MSSYLVHYAIAQRNAAVVTDEWNADRNRGRSRHAGAARARTTHASPLTGLGRVLDAARTSFGHLAIVPVPVIAR